MDCGRVSGDRISANAIPVVTITATATENPARDFMGWKLSLHASKQMLRLSLNLYRLSSFYLGRHPAVNRLVT